MTLGKALVASIDSTSLTPGENAGMWRSNAWSRLTQLSQILGPILTWVCLVGLVQCHPLAGGTHPVLCCCELLLSRIGDPRMLMFSVALSSTSLI